MATDAVEFAGLLEAVRESRSLFEEAVKKAELSGGLNDQTRPLVTELLGEATGFNAIEREASAAADKPGFNPSGFLRRAQRLAHFRAYLLPQDSLQIEARELVAEMRMWGVPAPIADSLDQLIAIQMVNAQEARAAFAAIADNYDYWDDYTDWYDGYMYGWQRWLVGLALASLIVALACLLYFELTTWTFVLALLLGGACGSLTSIAGRVPPLSVYGDATAFFPRMLTRFATGVLASATALGLLGGGIINVSLGQVTPASLVRSCIAPACPPAESVLDGGARLASGTRTDGGEFADGGIAPDGGIVAGAARSPDGRQITPDTAASGQCKGPILRTCEPAEGSKECSRTGLLVLLALAVLFGFSERALSRFEETVFGSTPPLPGPKTGKENHAGPDDRDGAGQQQASRDAKPPPAEGPAPAKPTEPQPPQAGGGKPPPVGG